MFMFLAGFVLGTSLGFLAAVFRKKISATKDKVVTEIKKEMSSL